MPIELHADSLSDVIQEAYDIVSENSSIGWVYVNKKTHVIEFQDRILKPITVFLRIQTTRELDLDKVVELAMAAPACVITPITKEWFLRKMTDSPIKAKFWYLKELPF